MKPTKLSKTDQALTVMLENPRRWWSVPEIKDAIGVPRHYGAINNAMFRLWGLNVVDAKAGANSTVYRAIAGEARKYLALNLSQRQRLARSTGRRSPGSF